MLYWLTICLSVNTFSERREIELEPYSRGDGYLALPESGWDCWS